MLKKTVRIVAAPHFEHAGNLTWPFGSPDPRENEFGRPQVEVDLRRCEFVRPPAVLWCAVYLLLAKLCGSPCRILVPENLGVCIYLKSLGLFQTFHDNGIEVDDRGVPYKDNPQLILPLTRFISESEVEELTTRSLDALRRSHLGSANIHPFVSDVFAELALNATQHAESPIGAYGLIQFSDSASGQRFVCGVADGSIGIRRSLEKNPELRPRVPYDWVAIDLAMRERVTSLPDQMRGIGLYWVADEMRKPGRNLIIHSGIGAVQINEDAESRVWRTRLLPGTLASVSIPT